MIRAALAGLVIAASGWNARIDAQAPTVTVTVTGLVRDTLREVNPLFVVRAVASPGGEAIRTVTLQIDDAPDFRTPIFELTEASDLLTIRLPRPLPHASELWWRGSARTATEGFLSEVVNKQSAAWVALLDPNRPSGSFLGTRRPVFLWTSAAVSNPPGPWRYTLEIINVATRQVTRLFGLTDTSASSPVDLEFNASYRWSVTASLVPPDSVRVESAGSFVIVDEATPRVTLLYQSFPNPFPNTAVPHTCIWFDLNTDARVALEVLDLRGNHVRWIVPARGFGPQLTAGRYGRAVIDGTVGCDPRLAWDGMSDDGRVVHPGVYLLRFRANGTETVRKMLFRGR